MLRGLLGFGKDSSPAPPKGKIEIVCPVCGAAQYEPRLAISTNCRKCGEHLRIEKKLAIASTHARPTPATVQTPFEEPEQEKEKPVTVETPPAASESKSADVPAPVIGAGKETDAPKAGPEAEPPKLVTLKDLIQSPSVKAEDVPVSGDAPVAGQQGLPGFGDMLKEGQSPESEASSTAAAEERKRTTHLPLPTPPPPVANASTLQKMKEKGVYQQQYFKDAQCFDCGHKFKVGRSSRSTTCPQCGGYISMEDVEVTLASTQAIRTRGDVTIRKNGHVAASSIQCRELRCHGKVEANLVCTGDAIFRTSGTLIGEVHCARFVVEKGSDIVLMNPVYADEMEIQAKVTGQLFSRRQILISSYGAVNGDVTARSVSIEPGGELNGAMNILRSEAAFPAPKL